MNYLNPSNTDIEVISKKLESKLIKSIHSLSDNSDVFEHIDSVNSHLENLKKMNDGRIYHPYLFTWYFELKKRINEKDRDSIITQLNDLENVKNEIKKSIDIKNNYGTQNGHCWDLSYKCKYDELALVRGNVQASIAKNSPTQLIFTKNYKSEKLFKALSFIKDSSANIYNEMKTFLFKILIFNEKNALGFADIYSHGLICLNANILEKETKEIAEEIIHEFSHIMLNNYFILEEFITNKCEHIYKAPLRGDLRSMAGLFHQVYVLARILKYQEKVGLFNPRYFEILNKFFLGISTIKENIKTQGIGKDILNDLLKVEQNLVPQIEIDELVLKQIQTNNIHDIAEIYKDQEVMRYYGTEPFKNDEQCEKLIIQYKDRYIKGKGVRWGIFLKEDDQLIGTTGFNYSSSNPHMALIGIDIKAKFWNKGYAKKAGKLIINFAENKLNIKRIEALIFPENKNSIKLFKKLNFKLEAVQVNRGYFHNKLKDLELYSKVN